MIRPSLTQWEYAHRKTTRETEGATWAPHRMGLESWNDVCAMAYGTPDLVDTLSVWYAVSDVAREVAHDLA